MHVLQKLDRDASVYYKTFRRWLIGGCFAIAIVVIALFAWKIHSTYIEHKAAARNQVNAFAQAVESNMQNSLQFIDLSLLSFTKALQLIEPSRRTDPATIRTLLSQNGLTLSTEFWVLYIDASGHGVAASNHMNVAGVDYNDRDYFKAQRDSKKNIGLFVGEPDIGRVSKKRLFYLSRRVEQKDGTFLGVIVAPVDAALVANMFKNAQRDDNVTLSLIHKSGKIIARMPDFDETFKRDIRTSNAFRQSISAINGTFDAIDQDDNLTHIVSYQSVENLPLLVTADVVRGGWDEQLRTEFMIACATVFGMILLMAFYARLALRSMQSAATSRRALAEAHRDLERRVSERTGELQNANALLNNEISERKTTLQRLALLEKCMSQLSDMVMITDANSANEGGPRIVYVNDAFEKTTGYSKEEVIGRNPRMFQGRLSSRTELDRISTAVSQFESVNAELVNYTKSGEPYWIEINIVPVADQSGMPTAYVAIERDITEKKASQELIRRQANIDPLTGLANRRMFVERLGTEIKKAQRANKHMSLLFLDLDQFKEVNDTLGHDVGDILLTQAAQRLNECVRETDIVARFGGDEFIILLDHINEPNDAALVAQKILDKMTVPFHLGTEVVYISTSIGITLFPEDGKEANTLLKAADQAMYAAKSEGRGRFNYFTAQMQEAAQYRMRLASDLRCALAENQFKLVYQPIVTLETGEVHKAEALIRWHHPVRGMVSPADFIPLAEDTGVIGAIGNWVFEESARQCAQWRASRAPQFQISVNASPVQFRVGGIDQKRWMATLAELGLPGQAIAIEITERLLLDVGNGVTNQLLAFRDAGMQVSLDDFGTGYSSLSYLKKFDIDIIKIDQSFVRNLTTGSEDLTLCEAIIVMAHKLGLKVVAEGIETAEQRDLLIGAGCDYGQGYYFSRPVPAEQFASVFAAAPALRLENKTGTHG